MVGIKKVSGLIKTKSRTELLEDMLLDIVGNGNLYGDIRLLTGLPEQRCKEIADEIKAIKESRK